MKNMIKNFIAQEDGQGMVEYGLIIAVIAVIVVVAISAMGGGLTSTFNTITEKLGGSVPAGE